MCCSPVIAPPMQSVLRGTDFLINYVTVNAWAVEGGLRRGCPLCPHIPPSCTPFMCSDYIRSPLLRARSAAQLLQHSPLAKIVPFNKHAETAFRPRFFICFPQSRKKRYEDGGEVGRREGVQTSTQNHTNKQWRAE